MLIKIASIAALGLFAVAVHELPDLKIGDALPAAEVKMKNVDGNMKTLKDLVGPQGLLVIFSCNTCPFVIGSEGSAGWEGRYPEVMAFSARSGVGVAVLNSNEAKRTDGDGFAEMRTRYKEKGYSGAYLLDEAHQVADAFGARTTPHVFLFNKNMKLVYKGAIDDNVADAGQVKQHWLKDAVSHMASGEPVDPATTRNIGCSIKRVAHEH
ncbi:MAG: redoxin family protein [Flavobacteriales bacterium]|nr:redoxin family protein [Flavobacteriales bacterium]